MGGGGSEGSRKDWAERWEEGGRGWGSFLRLLSKLSIFLLSPKSNVA